MIHRNRKIKQQKPMRDRVIGAEQMCGALAQRGRNERTQPRKMIPDQRLAMLIILWILMCAHMNAATTESTITFSCFAILHPIRVSVSFECNVFSVLFNGISIDFEFIAQALYEYQIEMVSCAF